MAVDEAGGKQPMPEINHVPFGLCGAGRPDVLDEPSLDDDVYGPLGRERVLAQQCQAAYVPFTYRDSSGKIVGFDVDVVGRYLAPIGVKAEFIDTQWSGVIPALYAGRFEMVPTMSYTKERLERVLFSIPYADASQALLIRSADKDKIKTIGDMSGRVLGVK